MFDIIRTCGDSFSHIIADEKTDEHKLITHGIYSILRHPSYFGWFYWSVGTQLILCNLISTVLYTAAAWYFFESRIPYEEYKLLEFYGEDYRQYMLRTFIGIPYIRTVIPNVPYVPVEHQQPDDDDDADIDVDKEDFTNHDVSNSSTVHDAGSSYVDIDTIRSSEGECSTEPDTKVDMLLNDNNANRQVNSNSSYVGDVVTVTSTTIASTIDINNRGDIVDDINDIIDDSGINSAIHSYTSTGHAKVD